MNLGRRAATFQTIRLRRRSNGIRKLQSRERGGSRKSRLRDDQQSADQSDHRPLLDDLVRLSSELEADKDLLVVVLRSANPDFFIAHFDVAAILEFPIEKPARHEDYANAFYHDMCERFRLMDKITIAQIEGRAGGGGSELAMSFDMRFGVRGKTIINQMEAPL